MKLIIILTGISLCAVNAIAQDEVKDSVRTQALDELVVEAQMQTTSATVSTYLPTSKQKNSSQTATELLNRMAIPQLSPGIGNAITTNTGKNVDI